MYDITPFISAHPGGKKILRGAGKEASEMFQTYHKGVDPLKTILKSLIIGKLSSKEDHNYIPKSKYAGQNFLSPL